MTWRDIEAACEDILRENGHHLDRNAKSGDLLVEFGEPANRVCCGTVIENVTAFSQALYDRLKEKRK